MQEASAQQNGWESISFAKDMNREDVDASYMELN